MASLKRGPHDMHITSAVERVVAPTVRHINQPALDVLTVLQILSRVHEIRSAELLRPLFLRIVDVYDNDLARPILHRALDD